MALSRSTRKLQPKPELPAELPYELQAELTATPFNRERARTIEEDLQLLIAVLPERIRRALAPYDLNTLTEVVLDLGRPPEARFMGGRIEELEQHPVTEEDIASLISQMGPFTSDNRAGIPRTLHRISAIRSRSGHVIGLTCRVGKAITGTIDVIKDLVESNKSILLLGPPGVGKTTKLREISKLLADQARKRVVIVDTSNEIAGDGDIPHPAVGRARRMQVSSPEKQKDVMIEAVENHTPEIIVVDEIGTEEESLAARTIAERGVLLVATCHGSTLESVIKNPLLSDLIGGIQAVTLGDDEARRRSSQKTVLERENKPTFDIAIEIRDHSTLAIYPNVSEAVDHILRGWTLFPEVRKINYETGEMRVLQTDVKALPDFATADFEELRESLAPTKGDFSPLSMENEFKVFLYGLTRASVEQIIDRLTLKNVSITNHLYDSNAILALRGSARPGSKIVELAKDYEIPVYVAKTNSMPQIQRALREAMNLQAGTFAERISEEPGDDEVTTALKEAQIAIDSAMQDQISTELAPRRSYIRRLQHELVEQNHLTSVSIGDEPNRRLKVLSPTEKIKAR